MIRTLRWPALLLAAVLTACAGPQIKPESGVAAELAATPFFAQEDHQCGPAALATVLAADGVEITPDQLTPLIYIPGRKGSLQTELVAATRHYGRVPYVLDGGLDALIAEVESGKPVLVLQNLGVSYWPAWHYAVVIGFDPAKNQLILRSGRKERITMGSRSFMRSWKLAEQWAMVVTPPGKTPASAQPESWVRRAAACESLNQPQVAMQAYEAGLQRWPQSPLLWFASANAAYAQHDLPKASAALKRAVELAPDDAAARNNYAQVLYEQGCVIAAQREIGLALQHASREQRAELERTQAQLGTPSAVAKSGCPD